MNIPLVSVRMITYNQVEFVSKAIESVLRQKVNFTYELLIGEDASTDGTADIVDYYQKKYPDIIKVFHRKKNVGYRANGQYIINQCYGKYIAVLEGDDYWNYNLKMQKQVDYLEKHTNIVSTAHNVCSIDKNGKLLDDYYIDFPYQKSHVYNSDNARKFEQFGHLSGIVYRNIRYILNDDQWRAYTKCKINGDLKLWLTLGMLGKNIYSSKIWSCRRRVFEGTSWSAITYQKNITYILFQQYIEAGKYLKQAFGVSPCFSNYIRLLGQSYKLCLPSKLDVEIAGKMTLSIIQLFILQILEEIRDNIYG